MSVKHFGPACTTCEFQANLLDVFNPDEARFRPDAPECYRRVAAQLLTTQDWSPLPAIRSHRPDTAAIIDDYAAQSS